MATRNSRPITFQQISDRIPLGQKVVARITEAISQGQLQAGDRLPTERELALQLGVSRTAVRDGIKLLAGQGILEVTHGSGIYVATRERVMDRLSTLLNIRQGTIAELFEVRKLIEVEAAGWAAGRARPEQVAKIEAVVQAANERRDDPAALAGYDAQFHLALAEAAHNGVLLGIMLNLLDLLAAGREESLRIPGRAALSAGEHEQILAAIRQGDPDLARREMWRHLDSVEQSVLQALREQDRNIASRQAAENLPR